jgi:outer membrane receptor protein involved in Fe transport
MSAQSLTFKSINTRGFNANGNTRFNQYIDGMDNQAPGLNFAVGNIIGISELDVDNVELLPGASSALYGAGGINGTMLMTSKDPFTFRRCQLFYQEGNKPCK